MRHVLLRMCTALLFCGAPVVASTATGQTIQDCSICPKMVHIPAGAFDMGDVNGAGEADELPVRRVTVAAFAMALHEVTVEEFSRFVEATGYDTGRACWTHEDRKTAERQGRNWRNPGFRQALNHPVTCVNPDDADAYVAWLNRQTGKAYRLPSEAEWEYAARAGTRSEYFWGDDIAQGCAYANIADESVRGIITHAPLAACNDGHTYTSPVGAFRPNAFGLYDMLGNVFEWLADCYQPRYDRAPTDGSVIGAWACADPRLQGRRVDRGGSWYSRPIYVRVADRNLDDHPRQIGLRSNISNRAANVGFRLARSLP